MVLATSSCDQPSQTRETQKSLQRSSKIPGCSPERKTSIWTRTATEPDRNDFFFPRTRNSTLSRHKSNVLSSCCPKQWQPLTTISLAGRSTAEDRSLRIFTTRFCGEELADLCKLRFCIKLRNITRKTTKILSKLSSKTSTWTISSSQPELPKKRLRFTKSQRDP